MEDILIKIFILKSKSCSYSLPKYKIKSSIVSVNKQITRDIYIYIYPTLKLRNNKLSIQLIKITLNHEKNMIELIIFRILSLSTNMKQGKLNH